MLTKRRMRILRILHERKDFITLSEIALLLGVSSKTVRNDLSVIREELPAENVLITRPNRGIRLDLPTEEYHKLICSSAKRSLPFKYKAQRGLSVAVFLLQYKGVALERIGDDLFLSRSAVTRAVADAEKLLSRHGICVRRGRGRRLSLLCDEYQWRSALWDFFRMAEKLEEIEEGGNDVSSSERSRSRLLWFLDGFDTSLVLVILERFERMHGFSFSYADRRLLLFHISLSLSRGGKKTVSLPTPPVFGFEMKYDQVLGDSLVCVVKELFSVELSEGEKLYIRHYLSMVEPQEFASDMLLRSFQTRYPKICDLTDRIVYSFSRILEVDFSSDRDLYNDMFFALRSAVARLSKGVSAENHFLNQTKTRYPKIMAAAWSVSVVLENELGLAASEDELGFLALHVCGAMERSSFSSRVLLLCNFGVGVSRLMKVRLEKANAGIVVDDVISVQDERKARRSDCDFIISSCPVEGTFGGKEVVVVDSFLSSSDIAAIKEKMSSIHKRKRDRACAKQSAKEAAEWGDLFDPEFVRIGVRNVKKEELLRCMCGELQSAGIVSPEYVDTVLSREMSTSTEVAEGVAIPHGSTKCAFRSLISVALLEEPILWYGENPVDVVFLLAFNATGKNEDNERQLRFYSIFAELLENNERMKALRRIESPEEFARFMNLMLQGEEGVL